MLNLLRESGIDAKKVSSTKGGEYHSACPGCGGDDRFHVWPEQEGGQGSFWCRGCSKAGDRIQFLRDFKGFTFKEAAAACGKALDAGPRRLSDPSLPRNLSPNNGQVNPMATRRTFKPTTWALPPELWQTKCGDFLNRCQTQLAANPKVIAWLKARGLDASAIETARLGWNPGNNGKDLYRERAAWGVPLDHKEDGRVKKLWLPIGLVIPCFNAAGNLCRLRIRRFAPGELELVVSRQSSVASQNPAALTTAVKPLSAALSGPRYYVIPGGSSNIMVLQPQRRALVVVESELDAILVAARTSAGCVALGSCSTKPDAYADQALKNALQILLSLDADQAGAKAATWWAQTYPDNCERWPVPAGKDPGEAFKAGVDLNEWVRAGLPPALLGGSRQSSVVSESENQPPPIKSVAVPDLKADLKEPVATGLPAPVVELGQLLERCRPVYFERDFATGSEAIRCDPKISRYFERLHPQEMARISELFFGTPVVDQYLSQHPAAIINGANYFF